MAKRSASTRAAETERSAGERGQTNPRQRRKPGGGEDHEVDAEVPQPSASKRARSSNGAKSSRGATRAAATAAAPPKRGKKTSTRGGDVEAGEEDTGDADADVVAPASSSSTSKARRGGRTAGRPTHTEGEAHEAEATTTKAADKKVGAKSARGGRGSRKAAAGEAGDAPQGPPGETEENGGEQGDADVKPANDASRHPSAPPKDASVANVLAPESHPTNTTVPDPLVLPDRHDAAPTVARLSCWNITSLKSAMAKGMMRYLDAEQADVVVLSETKVNEVPMNPALLALYPHQTWSISDTKGYAGVALLSKVKPLRVQRGIRADVAGAAASASDEGGGQVEAISRGRVISAEFQDFWVVGTYVVNAGEGLKTMDNKVRFNDLLARHIARLDEQKPVIWCGDLNVVMDHRDLSKAKDKWNKSAGYTEIECEWYRKFRQGEACPGAKPFVDIWRHLHPDAVGHFTYAGFRGQMRSKRLGWRLDSFIVSQRFADQVARCEIRHEVYGASDHVPVYADVRARLA